MGDFFGPELCRESTRAAPCSTGTQTTLAWEVGTHLLLHQKCLLEIIVLIIFIYLRYFFSSLPCGRISAGVKSDVTP